MATNRTNLELKRHQRCEILILQQATNRTNLELKQNLSFTEPHEQKATNRTNLELKQKKSSEAEARENLPIAPIWN